MSHIKPSTVLAGAVVALLIGAIVIGVGLGFISAVLS